MITLYQHKLQHLVMITLYQHKLQHPVMITLYQHQLLIQHLVMITLYQHQPLTQHLVMITLYQHQLQHPVMITLYQHQLCYASTVPTISVNQFHWHLCKLRLFQSLWPEVHFPAVDSHHNWRAEKLLKKEFTSLAKWIHFIYVQFRQFSPWFGGRLLQCHVPWVWSQEVIKYVQDHWGMHKHAPHGLCLIDDLIWTHIE